LSVHDKATPAITGATVLPTVCIDSPADWGEYYGARKEDGALLLYKAVDKDFRSGRGFPYIPGSTPEAPDWDGGREECGGGLHFCSSPSAAGGFFRNATRFVGCWVLLADLCVHKNARYPPKIKGRRVARPIFEVNIDGVPIVEGM
jgi:hypothetical protein